jgi:hypothetical protein
MAGGRDDTKTAGGIAHGMSWGHPKKGRLVRLTLITLMALVAAGSPAAALPHADGPLVSVIVRERPGAGDTAEWTVRALGGRVGRHIGIIDGFVAEVPSGGLPAIRRLPEVASVTPNARVRLAHAVDGFDASLDEGSMYTIAQVVVRAGEFWQAGYTGQGVDVALIDSGVVPVDGLTVPGKVVNGADLSFESQADNLRYLDTYGHGTHMAGIIAGRDDAVMSPVRKGYQYHDQFVGIAPDARIVNVKVADARGVTDVSQVLAAIDWVVQHRRDGGLNIRVLNLSFGTDGIQDYLLDPLTYAVEVAWRKGIVVVVSAGNEGYGSPRMNNPAYDPYVIAVGSGDPNGTYGHPDDEVSDFSSCGTPTRHPDLIAPGQSIVSLRDPGSYIDLEHDEGRVGTRFFRGSGTSQAAAIVSGAAALIISQRPGITPDQVKALLMQSSHYLWGENRQCQGAGMIDLRDALYRPTPLTVQTWPVATGLGSLDAARGSAHVSDGDVALAGEQDIFGTPWDAAAWSLGAWTETSWLGGLWNGKSWSGDAWSATSWAGKSWSAVTWTQSSWAGKSWSDGTWSGKSWSGKSWSGDAWSGKSWSSKSWSEDSWSGFVWATDEWDD